MKINLSLTKREAEAVLRAELSVGHGVRQSTDLARAQFRLHEAVRSALTESEAQS